MDRDFVYTINKVLVFILLLIAWHIYMVHSSYYLISGQEWVCVKANTQQDVFPACDEFVRQ